MAEKDIDKIEPVDFDLKESPQFSNLIPPAPIKKQSALVWVSLGGLAIVALFVVFVLPTIVTEYELPLERRPENATQRTAASTVAPSISPFEEAQRALQRKAAQDVLAALLEKQRQLDEFQVSKWGQVAYEAALRSASVGDDYYRAQDFTLAMNSYGEGRDALQRLIDSIPTVLAQTLIDAQKALEESNSVLAQEKFQLAQLLDPNSENARIGLGRARVLDEVAELIEVADQRAEDGDLEGARAAYRQASTLDSHNDYARSKISETSRRITEIEFARIMSSGYSLLEGGEPEQAIAAFQRAANVGINKEQADAAIVQAENGIANSEINRLRGLIASAEANEMWQTAVDEYVKVLAIDPNLLFALEGKDYATKRAQLDRLLVYGIANPARFAEDIVFQETRDVYFTGRAIENPGPRLQQQLDQLQVLLENSQVPIQVQIVSDNLTDVTLLRVGELGLFQQTSVTLKPGVYVAVGKRNGYREVRKEFTVGFGQTPNSVLVACDEPVVTSSRRR